jgi:hypothetical protein
MRKNGTYRVLTVVNLAAWLTLASFAAAQAKVAPASTQPEAAVELEQSSDGPKEGVKVHGHWTITVRNPDGTLSSQHEFENALINQGAIGLAQLLAHQANAPGWVVTLNFSGINPPQRILVMTTAAGSGAVILPVLSVSVPSSGANAGKLVLSATVPGTTGQTSSGQPISLGGQLLSVSTELTASVGTGVLLGLNGGNAVTFSSRDLTQAVPPDTTPPPPINLQTGQSLDVMVVFSFQ